MPQYRKGERVDYKPVGGMPYLPSHIQCINKN